MRFFLCDPVNQHLRACHHRGALAADWGIYPWLRNLKHHSCKTRKIRKGFHVSQREATRALPTVNRRTSPPSLDEINTHQQFLHLSFQVRNPTASAAGQDRRPRLRPLPDCWRPADTHQHSWQVPTLMRTAQCKLMSNKGSCADGCSLLKKNAKAAFSFSPFFLSFSIFFLITKLTKIGSDSWECT